MNLYDQRHKPEINHGVLLVSTEAGLFGANFFCAYRWRGEAIGVGNGPTKAIARSVAKNKAKQRAIAKRRAQH